MRVGRFVVAVVGVALVGAWLHSAREARGALSLDQALDEPIGRSASYLIESGDALTIDQAVARERAGAFAPSQAAVPVFGIGADPVWLHFRVENPEPAPVERRIAIDTAWLDHIDLYLRRGGVTVARRDGGDTRPFGEREADYRGFVFQHAFAPGVTEVFLRVATPDPMVLPMRVQTAEQYQQRKDWLAYGYGLLYGFLAALIAYNLMLFAGLRQRRYLLYSVYLGCFLLMNVAYTGHGFDWFWPAWPGWSQWANPVLMVVYGAAGLAFALDFLAIRARFPRVHRAVVGYVGLGVVLLTAATALGAQAAALTVAFGFVLVFSAIMVALGVISLRAGHTVARYFLAAAVFAMVGVAVTALAVLGVVPFTDWTYRAADVGMVLDATLLALALTYQIRLDSRERTRAEQMARHDPLTGLKNRRAFADAAQAIWNLARRHGHEVTVIMIDIDRFKPINDTHGHGAGDAVLQRTAATLLGTIRHEDVLARWGGEEFILLLPHTGAEQGRQLAERLREGVAQQQVTWAGHAIPVTISLGIAAKQAHHQELAQLIETADNYLLAAKAAGRDRVHGDLGHPGADAPTEVPRPA